MTRSSGVAHISSTPLIVGCGDVGLHLARALIAAGHRPVGLVRRQAAADALGRQGIAPVVADLDREIDEPPAAVENGTVFYLVPPPADAEADDPRLRRFLTLCEQALPQRIIYLGTTGVYGDCNGEWVDETRPPHPMTDRARRRLAAEEILTAWCREHDVESVRLRVGGIYGPGRLPIERLDRVTLIAAHEAPWSNRIHVDDLVTALLAAARRGRAGAVYNVSDGTPGTMTEYFHTLADLAGRPRPPTVPLAEAAHHLSPGMLSYARESRRLDTRRMREELGVTPRYPTVAEGLGACLQSRSPRMNTRGSSSSGP